MQKNNNIQIYTETNAKKTNNIQIYTEINAQKKKKNQIYTETIFLWSLQTV